MNFVEALGRVFLSTLFLYESVRKYFYQFETIEYMENFGVPEFLFYPSLIFELIIPILLIIGFKTRIAAAALSLFCFATAIIFHNDFADQVQLTAFLKNIALAGGFLFLVVNGAKGFCLDKK